MSAEVYLNNPVENKEVEIIYLEGGPMASRRKAITRGATEATESTWPDLTGGRYVATERTEAFERIFVYVA